MICNACKKKIEARDSFQVREHWVNAERILTEYMCGDCADKYWGKTHIKYQR